MKQAKIALYVALVFSSGALLGAFGHRFYATAESVSAKEPAQKGPAHFRVTYLNEMQTRVALNEDQLAKVTVILDETRSRMDEVSKRMEPEMIAIRKRMEPEIVAIRNEQIDKIRAILTPDQQLDYEKFRHDREERAKLKAKSKAQQTSKDAPPPPIH